jgi:stage II sporulation protein D
MYYRFYPIVSLLIILFLFIYPSIGSTEIYVRVLIYEGDNFSITGKSLTINIKGEKSDVARDVASIRVRLENNLLNLELGFLTTEKKNIRIEPNITIDILGEDICINENPYRGSIRILVRNNKILVVNIIPLEDYLYGVVPSEMPYYWPIEALKAQAVLARTYTLKALSRNGKKDYDLKSSVDSQVYRGKKGEHQSTNEAVDLTRGEVILYNNSLAEVFYHSTCGGHTEDVTNIWDIDNLPYLKGVECNYCENSQWKNWQRVIKREDWNKVIGNSEISIKYNTTGRLGEINGISGIKLRSIFNLPSTFIVGIDIKEDRVIINGRGYGHGVGLCQWGARGMAENGFNYKEVIVYYFPGVIVDAYRGF